MSDGFPVSVTVPLAVYPEAAVRTTLMALSADLDGEIEQADGQSMRVVLKPHLPGWAVDRALALFWRELLAMTVQRRVRSEEAALVHLFSSSAHSVRSEHQRALIQLADRIRREEDISPHVMACEPKPVEAPGCFIVAEDKAGGRVDLAVRGPHLPAELVHAAYTLRTEGRMRIHPGRNETLVQMTAHTPERLDDLLHRFLGMISAS